MTRSEYDQQPGINISRLIFGLRSMAHVHYAMYNPMPDSAAFRFGRAVHLLVFQPELFHDQCKLGLDGRTKDGKAQRQARPEAMFFNDEDFAAILDIGLEVTQHPTLKPILSNPKAYRERAIVWTDQHTGVECKGQLDFHDDNLILDLKTCEDASPAGFAREVARHHYHVKAAWYMDGLKETYPKYAWAEKYPGEAKERGFDREPMAKTPQRFIWIAVEKSPPHAIGIYRPSDVDLTSEDMLPVQVRYHMQKETMLNRGRATYRRLLEQYRDCQQSNLWPSYSPGIEPVSLPRWYEE